MKKNIDLLNGPVLPSLVRLALPIMATSFIQMAYNLIDMIWIGRIGSNAVASVGAASNYVWMCTAIVTLARMGGQVKVGHALGSGDPKTASEYAATSLQMTTVFGIICGIICILLHTPFIAFFNLTSPQVIADAEAYLIVTCGLTIFSFLNQMFTGIFTAMGNSHNAFLATTIGLIINIILDPLLIFGIGPFPALEVLGAAIATIFAQCVVTVMFLYYARLDTVIFRQIRLFARPRREHIASIVRIGFPSSMQSLVFNSIFMIIARLIAGYGDAAVAVQKVGSQIESLSWMTADGFSAALNSFISQNHGAGNNKRIKKGYTSAMSIMCTWGILCSMLLIFLPGPIFRIFISEADVIPMGIDYLTILGISQLFICIESTTGGAFSGYGRTLPPAVISITFMIVRVPLAVILSHGSLGLNGVWWSITITSGMKAAFILVWFAVFLRRQVHPVTQE